MKNTLKGKLLTPILAVLLLCGLGMETLSRVRPADATGYHKRIFELAKQLPTKIGNWVGTDEPNPEEAIRLLKPNVIYNRKFTNPDYARPVMVLIVQCKDARDIYGHYPPNCYPAHGMTTKSAVRFDRFIDGLQIHGTEYVFTNDMYGSAEQIVDDFILLPSGEVKPNMKEVKARAWDPRRRLFGAGQVQVVFSDPKLTDEERKQIFDTMVHAHMPVIKAILDGAVK